MKPASKSRCGTTLDQFFTRAQEPLSIDARPAIQSPSCGRRPRKGARVCSACTLLIAPGEQPPECAVASCPRELVPAPTDYAEWQKFIKEADQV